MFLPIFIILLSLLDGAFANAIVSPELLSSMKRFAEFSAAAYCPQNYVAMPANSSICPSRVCTDLPSSDITRVHAFTGTPKSTTFGILALDHEAMQIIVSFRGTTNDKDWETNIDFVLKDASDVCPDCWVHSGFLSSWRGESKPIIDFWKTLVNSYPDYNTVVTGHSLGGALANLCALELKKAVTPGHQISLFTYGAPRVGNQAFASYIEKTLGSDSYRMTHLNDPVPRLPGRLFGFRHPYPEYHITSPHIVGALSANESVLTAPANLAVRPEDILVLSVSESAQGNVGYSCSDIDMHDAYFMDISKCATGDNTPVLGSFAEDICDVLMICCAA